MKPPDIVKNVTHNLKDDFIMKDKILPLTMIKPGKQVKLIAISGGTGLRGRLNDMGLNEGINFKLLHSYHSGPCIVYFNGTRLVLGQGMANKILVEEI